jgi:type VI secretion system protein ImpK
MRLSDCFIELVAYVAYFARNAASRQTAFDPVKADILRMLSESQSAVNQGLVGPDDYDMARFAIVAWIDETLMNSAWVYRDQWKLDLLQRVYYQTTDAGEIFFERLNTIGLHQREVREVYYLCLAMGFQGRYCHEGDAPLLDQLKTSNLKLLTGASMGFPSLEKGELFPEAYPVDTGARRGPDRRHWLDLVTVAAALFPAVLFGGLYFIYSFVLSHEGDALISKVPR